MIVCFDKNDNVIGIDATYSAVFFGKQYLSMREACGFLCALELTMHRRIRDGKVKDQKLSGKNYRFNRADLLKMA